MVKKRTTILISVVIVAVVAIAAYMLLSNPDGEKFSEIVVEDLPPVESGNYTVSTGDTMKYNVFGYGNYSDHLEGSVTVTILDQDETRQKTRTEWSVYAVDEGDGKTLVNFPTEEQWSDKQDPDFEKDGTRTVRTLWGQEVLDYWKQRNGSGFTLVKEDITFAQYIVQDEYALYLELVDCDSFTQQKIERGIYEVELVLEATFEDDKESTESVNTVTLTNKNWEIFKIGKVTETYSYMDDGEKKTGTRTVTEVIGPDYFLTYRDDDEHTTDKIETRFGSLDVDVYTDDNENWKDVTYCYSGLLIKYASVTKDSEKPYYYEVELTSIKLNGERVKPDAVLSLLTLAV